MILRFIKLDIIFIIAFLVIVVLIMPYFITNSNPDSRFSGSTDAFNVVNIIDQNNLVGQISEIYFQANTVIFEISNPDISFRSIKNITIENYSGEKRTINYSPHIQIKHYKNKYLTLSNGYFDFPLTNFTMAKIPASFYNSIVINGTLAMNEMYANGGEISIDNYSIDYIIVGNENITNFKQIVFEMDKNGSIKFSSEISKLSAYFIPIEVSAHRVSNLKIEGVFSRLYLRACLNIPSCARGSFDTTQSFNH